jgi:aryl-alcohol dehydrogenase-like predicted oxidoreductase
MVRKRPFGATGLQVPAIGFGCGPTAGLMINASAEERRVAVAEALSLGINYFDTAPVYGDIRSETNLGQTLAELRAEPFLATKVALEAADFGDIAAAVIRSVEASVERLRSRVSLIQLHNRVGHQRAPRSEFGSGALLTTDDVLGPNGVLEAFESLRGRGLVRFFGCSAYGGEPDCVRRLVDSKRFQTLTLSYSALNPTAWKSPLPALRDYRRIGEQAAGQGMAIVALRVLEAGLLAGESQEAPAAGSEQARMAALAPRLRRAFEDHDIAPAEGAIRYALSQPHVSVAVIGLSNLAQIRQASAAAAAGPLPPALLEELEQLRTTGRSEPLQMS